MLLPPFTPKAPGGFWPLAMLLTVAGQAALAASPGYAPVAPFELNRYLGKWYEIARLPTPFEKGLVNVTATYSLRKDGKVKVDNEGYKANKNGKHVVAIGKAKLAADANAGYLRVSFFGPFYADYIIVDLDSSYTYAMVASSPRYLWILSRAPKMDQAIIDKLIDKAKTLGFDTSKLYLVPQEW